VLTLIAREGDLLDVDDGPDIDFRTISELDFVDNSGNEDGRSSGFNDLEQIAFRALFTDGTSGWRPSPYLPVTWMATSMVTATSMDLIFSLGNGANRLLR